MTNFDYVELPKPKVSGFDLSYSNKLTMDIGDLVPVYKQEVLPGDEFKVGANFMCRFAPLANPIYTKLDAQIHYFFVPNRLLWNGGTRGNNWETFITGGRDGNETPTPTYIKLSDIIYDMAGEANGDDSLGGMQSLHDYLGIPLFLGGDSDDIQQAESVKINALPYLAYAKIYDDWFRDVNLTNSIFDTYEQLTDGGLIGDRDTPQYNTVTTIKRRAWSKDYFTSALPWAQRGEEVRIPVGTTKFNYIAKLPNSQYPQINPLIKGVGSSEVYYAGTTSKFDVPNNVGTGGIYSPNIQLNAEALGTIRELRNASALQLWLEKNAVGGARYIEQLLAHFGVFNEDAKLQRAQYLGSVKSPVVISEVQSNAATAEGELGELAGKAVSYANDFAFDEKFTEHGWILGIMSIKPEASYAEGIHRSLTHRNEKLDYAFPEFAEIGLQEINNSEIYGRSITANDGVFEGTFGYGERYGEYKTNTNEIHGYFKDGEDTRSQYNMTRFFGTTPELNTNFVQIFEQDLNNPFTDQSVNAGNIWVDVYNDVKAIRPLPKHSIPLFN